MIVLLKDGIECKTPEVLIALRGWIDSVMSDPKRVMSKQQVTAFKNTLDDYCEGDRNDSGCADGSWPFFYPQSVQL